MALLGGFNLDKLKESVEGGVKSAQEAVGAGLASAQDAVGAGLKSAQEGLAGMNVDGVVQGAMGAVAAGKAKVEEVVAGIVPGQGNSEDGEASYREFISVLWYLVHVDGAVSAEERETLSQLAGGIDNNYASYADELEVQCSAALAAAAAEFGVQAAAKIEAQKVIEPLNLSPMEAKLMCWNLFALANSDGLDAGELDFIRFVSEKAGVSKATFEEFRNYSDAIIEIAESRESLKASDRSYSEIEPLVNELLERERVVLEAAQALVTDR